MFKNWLKVLLLVMMVNIVACNQQSDQPPELDRLKTIQNENDQGEPAENKVNVTVSILPQKYFVEKIAGDLVAVNVMVEPGAAPETYEPLPQQLAQLNNSSAYISIGVPFEEAWLEKIISANSDIVLVNSGEGIEKIELEGHHHHHEDEDEHDEHDHDEEKAEKDEHDHDDHDHDGEKAEKNDEDHDEDELESLDPHIWLSPKLAKTQAENIYEALVEIDPSNESVYQENLDAFLTEIDEIDRQVEQMLASLSTREFIIHHPSWGYYAQDYDLEQISLELEGQEVSSAEFVELIQDAKSKQVKYVFAQPQFNNKTVETFAREIGAEVVILDPLAENWSQNILDTTNKLAQAMK